MTRQQFIVRHSALALNQPGACNSAICRNDIFPEGQAVVVSTPHLGTYRTAKRPAILVCRLQWTDESAVRFSTLRAPVPSRTTYFAAICNLGQLLAGWSVRALVAGMMFLAFLAWLIFKS